MKSAGIPLLAALAGMAGTPVSPVYAQSYPSRSVRIVVPVTPGGGVDIVARSYAQKLSENTGQPFVVDNRAGAGGNIGMETVANAPPDGYTLLVSSDSIAINPSTYKALRFDPLKDFAPVGMTSTVSYVLVTSPDLPVNSVADIIALARAAKAPLSYASVGIGTSTHLAMEMLLRPSGVKMLNVPYTSTAQKNADVISGQVNMMFAAPLSVADLIRARKMKGIAISGTRRSAVLPDLPTVAESGVPGYEFASWNGMFAPARTPQAIVNQLNAELLKAISNPETRSRLASQGAEANPTTPAEFAAYFRTEVDKYAKLVTALGIPKE